MKRDRDFRSELNVEHFRFQTRRRRNRNSLASRFSSENSFCHVVDERLKRFRLKTILKTQTVSQTLQNDTAIIFHMFSTYGSYRCDTYWVSPGGLHVGRNERMQKKTDRITLENRLNLRLSSDGVFNEIQLFSNYTDGCVVRVIKLR